MTASSTRTLPDEETSCARGRSERAVVLRHFNRSVAGGLPARERNAKRVGMTVEQFVFSGCGATRIVGRLPLRRDRTNEVLVRYFQGAHDTSALRRDYDAVRARGDALIATVSSLAGRR
jgi:hypothetical protein